PAPRPPPYPSLRPGLRSAPPRSRRHETARPAARRRAGAAGSGTARIGPPMGRADHAAANRPHLHHAASAAAPVLRRPVAAARPRLRLPLRSGVAVGGARVKIAPGLLDKLLQPREHLIPLPGDDIEGPPRFVARLRFALEE